MIIRLLILVFGLFAPIAHAQELVIAQTTAPRLEWSYQPAPGCAVVTPTIDVQSSETFVGTYTRVARLLISATTYILPAVADNRYYRVATDCGNSNIVQYVAATPPPTSPTIEQRLTTLEGHVAILRQTAPVPGPVGPMGPPGPMGPQGPAGTSTVPPAPTSNFTVTVIDADHLAILGNCTSIRTSGSGTRRTLECVH